LGVKKRYFRVEELFRFGSNFIVFVDTMNNQETTMFRVRHRYELIVEWFRLNGGKDKNGAQKHPEVPAGLPSPEKATIAQIQLITELLKNGVLEKYNSERASNGELLGQIADEILGMLAAGMNGKGN
jgi:hypothetical protein